MLNRILSTTDWILRVFLAVILRCLGVLLKGVFRSEDESRYRDEQAERQEKKGEAIQRHMSVARHQKAT